MAKSVQEVRVSRMTHILVTAAAFVIVIAGMRAAQALLVPFLLAILLAVICGAPFLWLQQRKVPMGLALIIVIAVILGLGLLIAQVIGTSLADFSTKFPEYQARLGEKTQGLTLWLEGKGVDLSNQVLSEYFDPQAVMRLMTMMFSEVGGMLSNGFLISLTVIFMLLEAAGFPDKLRAISEDPDASVAHFDTLVGNIKRYVFIKTWISLATGVLVAILLLVLGVDFAVLWGLLAFLLNYVPNIGSILAAVPAVLLAFIQFGIGSAVLTGLGYLLINTVVGQIIEPKYMGRGLGLSTLVVFLSLVFWSWVLGPVGMVLSVILTMSIKIALESDEETRWIAILLSAEAEAKS